MKFGILYLMIHFPFIWWVKIGITGRSAERRAKQIDRAVLGFPVPVMIMFLPAVEMIEQALHHFFAPLHSRFYRGDGSTEWFWLPAGVAVFAMGLAYWAGLYFTLKIFL